MKVVICSLSAVTGGILSYTVGNLTPAFICLSVLVLIDFITGVIKAIKNKSISSETCATGIIKKCAIYLMIIVSHVADILIGKNNVVRDIIIFFYISNEGISIIENLSIIGLPIPTKIKEIFKQLKGNDND